MPDQMMKIVWKARFSDVDRKSSVMVLMSSLPAGCSRHEDQTKGQKIVVVVVEGMLAVVVTIATTTTTTTTTTTNV